MLEAAKRDTALRRTYRQRGLGCGLLTPPLLGICITCPNTPWWHCRTLHHDLGLVGPQVKASVLAPDSRRAASRIPIATASRRSNKTAPTPSMMKAQAMISKPWKAENSRRQTSPRKRLTPFATNNSGSSRTRHSNRYSMRGWTTCARWRIRGIWRECGSCRSAMPRRGAKIHCVQETIAPDSKLSPRRAVGSKLTTDKLGPGLRRGETRTAHRPKHRVSRQHLILLYR